MKKIRKNILLYIRRKLNFKYKIIFIILKKYTLYIYKMGYDDGYNFKEFKGCKKAEITQKTNDRK